MCEQWFNLVSSTVRLHAGSFFDGDIILRILLLINLIQS
ncbi:hypothetical protein D020_4106 [Vibrio parahaemolyticus SBR10290]|nr:hypothetical protein VP10329_03377 [Vibrio parahaemolyticus 10329]EQL85930.1 hypothetical protein D052_5069 [Vibrio parahaemolyticus 10290]ESV66515.1 hypothetical protein D021_4355 [Vibrio parahaemolyticus 10296]ESW42219.1 hypothetical protein D022_4293 [Vibrio parahaemolyticus 12310]ETT17790.1 hypothetical protein D023_4292 [Vibrio parahaemolyticus 3256]ETX51270.1 hypothetical protein D020_4106 [Vibrio parahaemolyticus SBR10290]EVU12923.1 hypothetical protein D046_6280 [Vibrio parahaemoly